MSDYQSNANDYQAGVQFRRTHGVYLLYLSVILIIFTIAIGTMHNRDVLVKAPVVTAQPESQPLNVVEKVNPTQPLYTQIVLADVYLPQSINPDFAKIDSIIDLLKNHDLRANFVIAITNKEERETAFTRLAVLNKYLEMSALPEKAYAVLVRQSVQVNTNGTNSLLIDLKQCQGNGTTCEVEDESI